MDQRKLWDEKWAKIAKLLPPTNFAKKSFSLVKDKGFKTLLDLGCGDGKDSIYFAEKGFDVTAVDFSKRAIELLQSECRKRKIKNIRPVVADIKDVDFDPDSFDIIFANLSLQYFSDKDTGAIFSNLHQMLKSGGHLLIKCKSVRDSLYGKGDEIEKDFYLIDGKTIHFFSADYLREKLFSFEIISLEETSSDLQTMDKGIVKSHFVEAVAKKHHDEAQTSNSI